MRQLIISINGQFDLQSPTEKNIGKPGTNRKPVYSLSRALLPPSLRFQFSSFPLFDATLLPYLPPIPLVFHRSVPHPLARCPDRSLVRSFVRHRLNRNFVMRRWYAAFVEFHYLRSREEARRVAAPLKRFLVHPPAPSPRDTAAIIRFHRPIRLIRNIN